MSSPARALAAAADGELKALGFLVDDVQEEAQRVVAFRSGPYSRQELALQLLAPDRLKASMRVCLTDPLVGAVRWRPASMALFGIPDEGLECEGEDGVEAAVRDVLGVIRLSVLPLLDRQPRGDV
jgi:hypothetical protein